MASPQSQDQAAIELDDGHSILPMTTEIDAYLDEVADIIQNAKAKTDAGVRTTDFTVTNFAHTKRDRLWALKTSGQFIDAVLVTPDGYREVSSTHRVVVKY